LGVAPGAEPFGPVLEQQSRHRGFFPFRSLHRPGIATLQDRIPERMSGPSRNHPVCGSHQESTSRRSLSSWFSSRPRRTYPVSGISLPTSFPLASGTTIRITPSCAHTCSRGTCPVRRLISIDDQDPSVAFRSDRITPIDSVSRLWEPVHRSRDHSPSFTVSPSATSSDPGCPVSLSAVSGSPVFPENFTPMGPVPLYYPGLRDRSFQPFTYSGFQSHPEYGLTDDFGFRTPDSRLRRISPSSSGFSRHFNVSVRIPGP
jgi:hypothetical protein